MRSGEVGRNWTIRPPARQVRRPSLELLGHGEAHARRDLLRLAEILVRRLLEALALERDDALVAAMSAPWSMVMARWPRAEQLAGLGASVPERASSRSASKRA